MSISKKPIDPTDRHIGQRIRARRMEIEMSQEKLGAELGVPFQQVQKYEKGANRVGGSRMQQIARALGVTPAYFFASLPETGKNGPDLGTAFMATSDGAALARVWGDIPAPVRRSLVNLAEQMAVS